MYCYLSQMMGWGFCRTLHSAIACGGKCGMEILVVNYWPPVHASVDRKSGLLIQESDLMRETPLKLGTK